MVCKSVSRLIEFVMRVSVRLMKGILSRTILITHMLTRL